MAESVSAIIPTFNRAHTLARAIESVLAQKGGEVEVIVVDDGSTDDTGDLLQRYGSRITVLVRERGGVAAARNSGIAAAKGDFIAFLDSDDEWLPDKTQIQLPHFASDSALGIAGCGAWFVEDGRVYDTHSSAKRASLTERLRSGPINTSGVMVRASCLHSLSVHFRPDLPVYEDSELWWRLAARHASVMLPELLVKSHRVGQSVSTSIDMEAKLQAVNSFYRYVLADDAVREVIGRDIKSFVAHRHYIASCSYYVNGLRASAVASLLAGIRENPLDRQWVKLAAVISLPPPLRPGLKRALEWIARHRRRLSSV